MTPEEIAFLIKIGQIDAPPKTSKPTAVPDLEKE
jgi:hypothetical protein